MAAISYGKVMGRKQAAAARSGAGEALAVTLAPRSVRRLTGDQRGLRIVCAGAGLWITQDGDPVDYFLAANEQFTVTKAGSVVMQGMR